MDTLQLTDPNSLNVYVSDAAARGRGVFARRKIKRDEIIERAPVIIIPGNEWAGMLDNVLANYVFDWGENDEHACVALGYVSLYNHSYTPNASLTECLDEGIMEVVALRDIEAGEEIFINYNGDGNAREDLWFDVISDS